MNEMTVAETQLSLEEIPENFCHPDIELISDQWLCIAATAWGGFLTRGFGAVVINTKADRVEIGYHPGSPCSCHAIGEGTYNPQQQVVVVLDREDENNIPIIIGGWPTPPQAYARIQAEGMDETLH